MRITVIGAGNAGTTVAADLTRKGHSVTILKTSNKLHNENFEKLKRDRLITVYDLDAEYSVRVDCVTEDIACAMAEAELVIIYIQTNYHYNIIEKIAPYIKDGQTFLIEPGYLSTCYFLEYTDKDITVIEAESSPIDCRITAPGKTKVVFKNVLNPFGVYPKSHEDKAKKILDGLQYPYILTENVVEAALHNPNVIVHTIGAIFSIPRIEYTDGDYWMYREVFTPHVWNVVESLDSEKMDILEKLGCARTPYVEACKLRNSTDTSADALEVFFDYAENSSPKGPDKPDSRYITEDVSEGLCLIESLGKYLGIETPTASALIDIASAALKRNFRLEGRNVDRLGIDNLKKIING